MSPFFAQAAATAAAVVFGWEITTTGLACAVGAVVVAGWLLIWSRRSAQSRAQAALAHQRDTLANTLDSLSDAVIVADALGQVTRMNPAAAALTAWGDEAIGAPVSRVLDVVDEATGKRADNLAARAARDAACQPLPAQAVLVARDGRRTPIEGSAAPMRDGCGRVVGAVLAFRDISDRRLAEAERRDVEEQFHAMAETIPGVLYTARPDGWADYFNRWFYEFSGLRAEQAEGWGWRTAVHPDDAAAVEAAAEEMVRTGAAGELKLRLRDAAGRYRWFLHRSSPIRDRTGRIAKWLGACTDIDDLVRAEEMLKEADHRKNLFLATLAHELRNPLAPISNSLQVWPHVKNDPREMEVLHDILNRQVQQMIRLIDDLLDVSRITRGKIELQRQQVDVAELVSSAVESVRPFIDQCEHQLTIALPREPVRVDADVTRMVQVLSNILHNAAKYTGRRGRIEIAVTREQDQAVIAVRDNGPGIPPAMLSRVFDMFTQVDQTLDRAQGGLGIGLTLVKNLVQLHGGSVAARSAGPNQGAEFIVRLPALAAGATTPPERPRPAAPAAPRRRVLVVDDVQASAKTLVMMLKAIGQDVEYRTDGPSAIDAVRLLKPQVVFLDIAMPGMDGYEVARRISQLPESAGLALVALTGYGQEDDRRRALEAGFAHHLVKPASLETLEQLLTAVGSDPS